MTVGVKGVEYAFCRFCICTGVSVQACHREEVEDRRNDLDCFGRLRSLAMTSSACARETIGILRDYTSMLSLRASLCQC